MRGEPSPSRGRGFGWEKVLEECIVYGSGGVSSREGREVWGFPRGHVLLGGPDVLGVVLARKLNQYEPLARLIALK